MIPDCALLSLDFRAKTLYNIRESKGICTYCAEHGLKRSMPVGVVRNPRTVTDIVSHVLMIVNDL